MLRSSSLCCILYPAAASLHLVHCLIAFQREYGKTNDSELNAGKHSVENLVSFCFFFYALVAILQVNDSLS